MVHIAVGILVFIIGILVWRDYDRNYVRRLELQIVTSIFLLITSSIFVMVSTIIISFKGIEYQNYYHQRNAFVQTLEESRANPDQYNFDNASITTKISKYNEQLSQYKYFNSHWFLDVYFDDRFNDLEPIK